ncbi:hypothetical protein H072_9428 [Dactylellina haptotyla CBS 200.50]|uniref:RING-type domain-containing protein n=1 Tax=Dactylellina haptotyla (strain CBS 200.50) TaxID=1284197 RepID=S8A2N8_DACHA|nr:hypothetical protein H072_9428 [Dactylellina haptotyla CBS 200.50]
MSSMSGYMLMTGSPFLQDIRKQRKLEKEAAAAAEAERQNAARRAMMLGVVDTGEVTGERPGIGRTITGSTKASTSTESEETLLKRGLNLFGHRRKKKSKDIKHESTLGHSRFDLLSFRPSSPMFGLRSQSPVPSELRPNSPIPSSASLRVVSPIPGERPEIRTSLESIPSIHSSNMHHADTPEPKTNLSAHDILFGGRQSIPPPPPPKPYVAPVIPNLKEDPIMSSLSPATIVKPKTPITGPVSPVVSPLRARPPPLQTYSEPIISSSIPPPLERHIPPGSDDTDHERARKCSESSDFDGEKDKKRQHWLIPSSPQTTIINEKLYNELPLDTTDMPMDPAPSRSAPRPEKDPSMFAPRPDTEDAGEFPADYPPPPPFEEEETVPKPEFSENLKAHLRGSDRAGQWWRLYAPPPELSYIPENTPVEILNLYNNDEQLELDIKRIQSLAPAQPNFEAPTESRTKRSDPSEELSVSVEEVGYNSHRASTHTAEGTIFSRRSIATTATSVSDAGAPENMSPVSPTQPSSQPSSQPSQPSAAAMARWTAFSKWGPSNRDSLPAYSPMRDSFMAGLSPRKNDTGCAMCMEDLTARRMIAIDCHHKYCNACLRSIILAALNDEIAFPPKCCTSRIPVRAIRAVCNLSEQAALNHKIREYSQRPEKRVYCPNETCGRFIPPESVNDFRTKCLVCQFCQTRVCPTCRGRAHFDGNPCPKEEIDLCFGCGATGAENCECKVDADKVLDWGKTRMYESGNPEEMDSRIEEMTVHSAIADMMAYERRAARDQFAQEEASRVRRAKEKMEKKRKEDARMTDLSKKYDKLTKQLENLLEAQSSLMEARLAAARAELMDKHEEGEARMEALLAVEDETLETRVSERSIELDLQLEAELRALDARFEEDEDDVIMMLTRQHRGKPNREERIKSAVDRLKIQQEDEKDEVRHKFSARFAEVRSRVLDDIEFDKQDIMHGRDSELAAQYDEWHEAARREYADEKWFAAVKEIRKEHLAIQFEAQKDEYRRQKLESELEESFKLTMMLELEDERDKVYSSGRPRDTSHVKMPMI